MGHYLLTGTAGFIGSKVAEFLLADGHTVVGLDNLNPAYDLRLKAWRLKQLTNRVDFTFCQVDICDRLGLERIWREGGRFDAVLNLAARAGVQPSVQDPWIYAETNAVGTLNLLDLCREFGVSKFVLASTSSLYGNHNPMPYREDADTNKPLSPYAASKKAAEVLCYTYHHLYQIDVTVFRYFTVYGPAGRPDMSIFRFIQWISEGRPLTLYGDGSQSRDFTYVDDIARGTIAGLQPMGYAIVNLGSDHPVVLRDVIEMIEARVGRDARINYKPAHPADVPATWADISHARASLHWTPSVSFAEGIENAVCWYEDNRDWAKDIETL